MSKIAIVYWSQTGNTEQMANIVVTACKGDLLTCDAFDAGKTASYDSVAFGCPAMGAEELEETEFRPMFDAVKPALTGKKVALFGSYGWGDGEWMRLWADECAASGIALCCEPVICCDAPDSAATEQLETLAASL